MQEFMSILMDEDQPPTKFLESRNFVPKTSCVTVSHFTSSRIAGNTSGRESILCDMYEDEGETISCWSNHPFNLSAFVRHVVKQNHVDPSSKVRQRTSLDSKWRSQSVVMVERQVKSVINRLMKAIYIASAVMSMLSTVSGHHVKRTKQAKR